jgi:hypothetical protein
MKKDLLAWGECRHYCHTMQTMKQPPNDTNDGHEIMIRLQDTEVKSHRTSILLQELVLDGDKTHITLGEILSHLGERAFGFMIFLLAILNCLPMPPGFSTLTGVPILLLVTQLLLGDRRPNLPKVIREKEFEREGLAKAVRTIMPGLKKFEALFKPRWMWLSTNHAERGIAVLMLLLTLVLVVPMPPPFNFLPASAVAIMALGLIERDGIVISIGAVAGMTTLAMVIKFADLIWKVLMGMYAYILHLPAMIFG